MERRETVKKEVADYQAARIEALTRENERLKEEISKIKKTIPAAS